MSRIYAAAIELNTLHDHTAPIEELKQMAKFDEGDGLYATPVSGDALAKVRKLGITWATNALILEGKARK